MDSLSDIRRKLEEVIKNGSPSEKEEEEALEELKMVKEAERDKIFLEEDEWFEESMRMAVDCL